MHQDEKLQQLRLRTSLAQVLLTAVTCHRQGVTLAEQRSLSAAFLAAWTATSSQAAPSPPAAGAAPEHSLYTWAHSAACAPAWPFTIRLSLAACRVVSTCSTAGSCYSHASTTSSLKYMSPWRPAASSAPAARQAAATATHR